MDRTKRDWANWCFGGDAPKVPALADQQKEERVKEILLAVAAKKEAERREEIRRVFLKKIAQQKEAKERKQKRAEALKKVVTPNPPKEKGDLVRRESERYIDNELKKLCPSGSLVDRLRVAATQVRNRRCSSTVLTVLIERIRRNQWDKLSHEEQCRVIQAEASLGKQTN